MVAWQFRISSILFAAALAGCATPVSTNIKASPAHVAKYSEKSELDVVATLEKNLNDARAANMPFLAPHYFQEAAQVLSECQSQLGTKPREVLVSTAAKGDAILEKGRAVMAIVRYRFAKELELKSQIDAHGAAKLLPKDYERVMRDFSGLIEKVEREQPASIGKDKEGLQKNLLDLLIKAVQEGALHDAEAINADSKKKNAEKQAPLTYAEALKAYQDAKGQIAAGYQDEKLVQRLGAQALFAARHAQQVNDRVALLQAQLNFSASAVGSGVSMGAAAGGVTGAQVGVQMGGGRSAAPERLSLEKVVLQEEDRLQSIATAMGLKDLRDLPLDKQVEEIKRAAGELGRQAKGGDTVKDLEARLKTANDAAQQAASQLAAKDKALADKDAELKALSDRVRQLEGAKKAKPAKAKP